MPDPYVMPHVTMAHKVYPMSDNAPPTNHNAFETFLVLISVLCFFLCFVNPLMVLVPALGALGAVLGYRFSPAARARWEKLPVRNVPRLVKGVTLFGFFATKKLDAWLEQRIPKRQSWVQPLSPLASLKG